MDCCCTRKRIPALVDRELGDAETAALREHLGSCPACAAAAAFEERLVARLRAAAGTETAPAGLAERVRASLTALPVGAEAEPRRPAATGRRAVWGLSLAAAAALLIALLLPWSPTSNGMVTAMAEEHTRRVSGSNYRDMGLVSDDTRQIEKYLTDKLGVKVDLPVKNVPAKKGACCGKTAGRDAGIVGCFCSRRNKAVTIFVTRAEGLDLTGLERVVQDGREFLCGASGRCRAVMWMRGELCYALVGELDPDDLCDMARRAANTLDGRDAPSTGPAKTPAETPVGRSGTTSGTGSGSH